MKMMHIAKNIIQSSQNQQFKHLKRLLLEHAFRQKQSRTILEGVHLVQDWCRQNPEQIEYIFASELIAPVVLDNLNKTKNAITEKIIFMADSLWRELTPISSSHELLATIHMPMRSIDLKSPEAPAVFTKIIDKYQRILILENIQDTGNLGAIIRTAAAAGYGLIIQIGGANAFHPKVLRAAMGGHLFVETLLIDSIDLHLLQNLLEILPHQILVTDLAAEKSIYQTDIYEHHIWVMGNEGQGISSSWRQLAQTTLVKIPQLQAVESLNVGHACALCLYESVRRDLSI
jgi:RNA methyltransferase, TrmH family